MFHQVSFQPTQALLRDRGLWTVTAAAGVHSQRISQLSALHHHHHHHHHLHLALRHSQEIRVGQEREARMSATKSGDARIQYISDSIRCIPDFPHKGIMFRDVTTLLLDHKAFKDTIDIFVERYRDQKVDVIVGVEARGFIFGPPIALAIGAKFVPMRKPRKLPGPVIRQEYSLEYGTDCIEMHVGAIEKKERVVVVDDLIATGGTLGAAIKLLEQIEAEIVECACLVELVDLKGREKLGGQPLYILVEYEGE